MRTPRRFHFQQLESRQLLAFDLELTERMFNSSVSELVVKARTPIDIDTVAPSDFEISGNQVSMVATLGPDTLLLQLAEPLPEGNSRFSVPEGVISSVEGEPNARYRTWIRVDTMPPRVSGSHFTSLPGTQIYEIDFTEAVTVRPEWVRVIGESGEIAKLGFERSNSRIRWRTEIDRETELAVVITDEVTDSSGWKLDGENLGEHQSGDGIEGGQYVTTNNIDWPTATRVNFQSGGNYPAIWREYDVNGQIGDDDTDGFVFESASFDRYSLTVHSTDSVDVRVSMPDQPSIQLEAIDGVYRLSDITGVEGTVSLSVSGVVGAEYSVQIQRNIVDEGALTVSPNDSVSNAAALDEVFVKLSDKPTFRQANVRVANQGLVDVSWFTGQIGVGEEVAIQGSGFSGEAPGDITLYQSVDGNLIRSTQKQLTGSDDLLRFSPTLEADETRFYLEVRSLAKAYTISTTLSQHHRTNRIVQRDELTPGTLIAYGQSGFHKDVITLVDVDGNIRHQFDPPFASDGCNGDRVGAASTLRGFIVAACESELVEVDATGNIIRRLPNPGVPVDSLASNGYQLFVGTNSFGVTILDYHSGQVVRTVRFPRERLENLAFDGTRLLNIRGGVLSQINLDSGNIVELESSYESTNDTDSLAVRGDAVWAQTCCSRLSGRSLIDSNYFIGNIRPTDNQTLPDFEGLGGDVAKWDLGVEGIAAIGDRLNFRAIQIGDVTEPQMQFYVTINGPNGFATRTQVSARAGVVDVSFDVPKNGRYSFQLEPMQYLPMNTLFHVSLSGQDEAFFGAEVLNISTPTQGPVDTIIVHFDAALEEGSVTSDTLSVNGTRAHEVTLIDPSTAAFKVETLVTPGDYVVEIEPQEVTSTEEHEFFGLTGTLTIDKTPPMVESYEFVSGNGTALEIYFDEPASVGFARLVHLETGDEKLVSFTSDGPLMRFHLPDETPNGEFEMRLSKLFDLVGNEKTFEAVRFEVVRGDLDNDGSVNVSDVDLLCAAIADSETAAHWDTDLDGDVDVDDFQRLAFTYMDLLPGDVNTDGVFDSSDLVAVFQLGEYEEVPGKQAGWESGDWNCDRDFNSSDLVVAFERGLYQVEATQRASDALPSSLLSAIAHWIRSSRDQTPDEDKPGKSDGFAHLNKSK